jgi:hypothetical protein
MNTTKHKASNKQLFVLVKISDIFSMVTEGRIRRNVIDMK